MDDDTGADAIADVTMVAYDTIDAALVAGVKDALRRIQNDRHCENRSSSTTADPAPTFGPAMSEIEL